MTHLRIEAAIVLLWLLGLCACASPAPIEDPDADTREGARLLAEGHYQEAMKAFRRSIAADPTAYLPHMGMARAHAHLGRVGSFEAFALEAGSLAPRSPLADRRLGVMYLDAAQLFARVPAADRFRRLALVYLRRAFAVARDDPAIAFDLARALQANGDDRTAVVLLEGVYSLDERRMDVLQKLLGSLRRLDRRAEVHRLLQPLAANGQLPEEWRPLLQWAATPETRTGSPSS